MGRRQPSRLRATAAGSLRRTAARALGTARALLIEGPKGCGKTWLAKRFARSEVLLEQDPAAFALAQAEPNRVLDGATPRLIDEWQRVPPLWAAVRGACDARAEAGQFILTGSATPSDHLTRHFRCPANPAARASRHVADRTRPVHRGCVAGRAAARRGLRGGPNRTRGAGSRRRAVPRRLAGSGREVTRARRDPSPHELSRRHRAHRHSPSRRRVSRSGESQGAAALARTQRQHAGKPQQAGGRDERGRPAQPALSAGLSRRPGAPPRSRAAPGLANPPAFAIAVARQTQAPLHRSVAGCGGAASQPSAPPRRPRGAGIAVRIACHQGSAHLCAGG